jgi:CheY-like chemotaxis protein
MITDYSEPYRVLIADDNQNVLNLLVDLLVAEGYEVASASNGGGVFELALSFEPDLIISDVVMPVLDGIRL